MIAILIAVVCFAMIAVARWSHLAWRHWEYVEERWRLVLSYVLGVMISLGGATAIVVGLCLDRKLAWEVLIGIGSAWASFAIVGGIVAVGHWLDESREAEALRGDVVAEHEALEESRGER